MIINRKVNQKTCLWLLLLLSVSSSAWAHPIDMDIICKIESACNDNARGSAGEIGRYQIRPIVLKHFNQLYQKRNRLQVSSEQLKDSFINYQIADWYMNWLYDRCWTVEDTLIAWNWGIGNWRDWKNGTAGCEAYQLESGGCAAHYGFETLPKITQAYLKKYQELGGKLK